MPWKANTIVEARREFVALAQTPTASIRSLCRRFGISAHVGYKVLNRFLEEGKDGLRDRSRRPKHSPGRSSEATEKAILAARSEHPSWGGRRIALWMRSKGEVAVPAPSTQITVQVQALDSQSFLDHSHDIAQAVRQAMLETSVLNDVIREV